MESHHCLNCGTEYEGNYCPQCGQSHKVKRITASNIADSFLSNVIGLEGSLPRTLIGLLYRPGHLIADYISGKRKIYSNPFSTLLLLVTVFLFLNQYVTSTDIRETSKSFNREFSASIATTDSEQEEFLNEYEFSNEIVNQIYDNFSFFNLISCLILTIPFWLAYRKQGRYKDSPINIYEAAAAMAYFSCINMIINIISLPLSSENTIALVSTIGWIIIIPMFLLTVWQMFQMSLGTFLWRLILFICYFTVFLLIAIFIPAIIYGMYIMQQGVPD